MTETVPKDRPLMLDVPILHYSKNDKNRRVVAGYASFDVIDRQGEKITQEAMKKALAKFMSTPEFANTHVMHGNVAVGKVIESYTDKNGELWETKVDDTGTFIVSELRPKGDLKRADQTWELIEQERLKSYSIGGLVLSPKELVCPNGTCHWVIDEIEIHEFSYVDRPAVKGADFIIIKRDGDISLNLDLEQKVIKAMTCPLDKPEDTHGVSIDSERHKLNKQRVLNAVEIIMTDTPVEEISEPIAVPDPEPTLATTSPDPETEKADATPLLLELKAMVEKLTNTIENMASKPTDPEPKKLDYPPEKVDALSVQFGSEKAIELLELIGEEAFALITAVKEEPVVEPQKEPEPEPEVPEVVAETVDPEVPTEEPVAEVTEKMISEKVEAQVESTLAEYAEVNKRTLVPVAESETGLTLDKIHRMNWSELAALRGA